MSDLRSDARGGPRTVFALGGDEGRRNRGILAVAGSIAVHEVLLGVIAWFALFREPTPPPQPVVAEVITVVVHHPTPPTPPPTPIPTPAPTPPRATPTPRIAVTDKVFHQARPRAAATPAQHEGGQAAPLHRVLVAQHAPVVVPAKPAPERVAVMSNPSWQNGPANGQANGGAGTGAGPSAGNGGDNGTDSGTGGNGNDPGMDTPLSPCGEAYFDEVRSVTNEDGSVYVQVKMRVRLRDGHQTTDLLHWYFYYHSADDDPFLPSHEHEDMRLQFPPQGFDLSDSQTPAIVLAIRHTRSNGTTDLPDCPGDAPSHKG